MAICIVLYQLTLQVYLYFEECAAAFLSTHLVLDSCAWETSYTGLEAQNTKHLHPIPKPI